MKRAILALFVSAAAASPSADFDQKLAAFHQHYDRFMRAYLGCPKRAASIDDCKPALGTLDYAEFGRARNAARELFDFRESQ